MTAIELFTRDGKPFKGRAMVDEKGRPGYLVRERPCSRCGGVGGSDKWKFTGWRCFECNMTGVVPCNQFVRLYDADRLATLNKAAATREANRQQKEAERAAAEAARVEAERESVIAAHAEILARMAPWAGVSEFLADMGRQVTENARPLSDRQLEAATNACAKFEAEKARRETAAHVGTVGERVELELSLIRRLDLTRSKFDPVFIIWTFRTPDGNTVVFKGGDPKAFDALYERVKHDGEPAFKQAVMGRTIRLNATIKAHGVNAKTGEPETIIQRPAAA